MTLTICIKCGSSKVGAFTPGLECGYDPEDNDARARGLMLTDHFYSPEELESISARIKSGETLRFDEAQIAEMKAEMDAHPLPNPRGCGFLLLLGLLLVALAIAYSIFW